MRLAKRPAALITASLAALATSPASAQAPPERPGFSLTAGTQLVHDNNLFRLADGVDPRQAGYATNERGDTIAVPSAAFEANLLRGRQRVDLRANLSREILLRNSQFDLTDLSYQGLWQWQLGNEWSGELADSQQQQRTSFADTQLTQANRQTTRERKARADYRPRPDRRLGVSYDESLGSNSLGPRQINDFRITVARAELGFDSGLGSEIVAAASSTRGEYPNRQIFVLAPVDNSYRQAQFDLSTRYAAGAKTQLELRIGYAKRRYPQVSQRNFGGLVGDLGLAWEPTAKLSGHLRVSRDLNGVDDYDRIYTVSTKTSAGLTYQASAKVELDVDGSASRVRFQGDPQNFFTFFRGPAGYREDRYDRLKFSLSWLSTERLSVQLAQTLETRQSNFAGAQYRDWTTLMSLQYLIGPWD